MSIDLIIQLLGGLALFLLAMTMMTDGLKVFAGSGLKRLLGQWTSTPLRGVFAGILVTGVVQSSSAVTVAAIGFVNAGLLTLRQALGVIFGTNVGTTMTGWLVSLVGFGVRIDRLALPILAVGVLLRVTATRPRRRALGEALAGFGLFFLGLSILKDAFSGLAEAHGAGLTQFAGHWSTYLLAGFVATVLAQSSSAALAIILSAAAGGVLGFESAAAAVIGANLGTTSTAAMAAIKATPAAKRLALGHIVFNLAAALIALLLLPLMLMLVVWLALRLELDSPAAMLALFHSVFNVLGLLLMLPFTARLAQWLERLFRSAEDDIGRAQHLDATVAATPALAVAALRAELLRLRRLAHEIASDALAPLSDKPSGLGRRATAVRALGEAIAQFSATVRSEAMATDVAIELSRALRTARYLDETARLAVIAAQLREQARGLADDDAAQALATIFAESTACLALVARSEGSADGDAERSAAMQRFESAYEHAKSGLLSAAVARRITIEDTDTLLDALSALRRMLAQLVKADRLLRSPARAVQIEAEGADT